MDELDTMNDLLLFVAERFPLVIFASCLWSALADLQSALRPICIKTGHLLAKSYEHLFYTLPAVQLVVLVFGVFGPAIAAPKALRCKCVQHSCALPLSRACASTGSPL